MQSFTMRPATGNGPFSWHRAISSSEKRAFWSYRVGYLLDAMDSQFLSFVIPTLIATWGITRRCRVDRDAVTLFDLPGRRMGSRARCWTVSGGSGHSLRRARSPVAPTRTTTCGYRGPSPAGIFATVHILLS